MNHDIYGCWDNNNSYGCWDNNDLHKIKLVPIPACSREREEALKAPPLAEELLAFDGQWGRGSVFISSVAHSRLPILQWMASSTHAYMGSND